MSVKVKPKYKVSEAYHDLELAATTYSSYLSKRYSQIAAVTIQDFSGELLARLQAGASSYALEKKKVVDFKDEKSPAIRAYRMWVSWEEMLDHSKQGNEGNEKWKMDKQFVDENKKKSLTRIKYYLIQEVLETLKLKECGDDDDRREKLKANALQQVRHRFKEDALVSEIFSMDRDPDGILFLKALGTILASLTILGGVVLAVATKVKTGSFLGIFKPRGEVFSDTVHAVLDKAHEEVKFKFNK
ncbi:MAG: hypothetical protein HY939_02115 [Gammaproteobacteria bacterium]|nr:hypothetical protein [Gammaproteobacteria bacterium]